MMQARAQALKSGALYFALVFGAGFVLGAVRVLWPVRRFGERVAELMEAPVMLGVTVLAARWVIWRPGCRRPPRLASGWVSSVGGFPDHAAACWSSPNLAVWEKAFQESLGLIIDVGLVPQFLEAFRIVQLYGHIEHRVNTQVALTEQEFRLVMHQLRLTQLHDFKDR